MLSRDDDSIHRDGGMLAGGMGYSIAELQSLPPLTYHSCGLPGLDEFTGGGLYPGAMWTLAAPSGLGATGLAVLIAVAASRTGRVLLVNGHIAAHLLRDRVLAVADAMDISPEVLRSLRLASWLALADWEQGDEWRPGAKGDEDVVIFDTLDEMWRPPAWPEGPEDRIRRLRWQREMCQRRGTAVVVTARVRDDGARFPASWGSHWAHEVFADIADVRLELRTRERLPELTAYGRGQGWWRSRLFTRPPERGAFRAVAVEPERQVPA